MARASVRVSHYVAEAQIWPALKVLYSHKFALYRAMEHSNQKALEKMHIRHTSQFPLSSSIVIILRFNNFDIHGL